MLLSDAHLRLSLGANIATADPNASGAARIGRDVLTLFPSADIAWSARITFNGGSATLNVAASTLTADDAPIAQVETATIVAAAGCTSSGNLSVTVTSNYISGTPVTVLVPLTTTAHTSAALIAAAVRASLAANSAIAVAWTVGGTGADITLTRKLDLLGTTDATLNIAIAAARGVSAVVDSVATTAGQLGCSIERLGHSGDDLLASALPTAVNLLAMAAFNASTGHAADGSVYLKDQYAANLTPRLDGSNFWVVAGNGIFQADGINSDITLEGTGVVDLIILASST